jgi:hypothetical protein
VFGRFFSILLIHNTSGWLPSRITTTGKTIPLQAWTGPEGSKRLRLPDFNTFSTGSGKVVSPKHRPLLPSRKIFPVLISVRR